MTTEVPFTELLSAIIDNRGRTCPTAQTGLPLIATNCVRNDLLYPALEKVRYVCKVTYEDWFRGHPVPGDLVFVCKGSPGRVCMTPDPVSFCIAQDMVAVRADPNKVYPKYLFALLRSQQVQAQIGNMHVGTLIPHFKKGDFDKLLLPVPDKKTQEIIGDTYFELSAKIELNRRMNATLEAMARALFQSWFVDFDPVRAKQEGRKPTGMDSATAAIFPEHLEDSKLGHVPKGWRACTLGDIAKNVSITFDFKRTPEVVFINTGDVLEGDFLHSKRSPHAGLPGQAKKSIRPDDILFSEIRPANKRYAYVDFDSSDYVVSTKFMIIRGSKEIHPRLLYRILTAKETLDEFQVQAESRSGTFPQITFDSISHLPIVLPPIEIQEAFQLAVGQMDAQIKVNKQQSRTLATLRDTLLPKLLNGELSVTETAGGLSAR
jgi:type I restriction enzyme, S subunit